MKVTEVMWPLFWCLTTECQAALMQYQWDNYGFRLKIPPRVGDTNIDTELEPLEELARLMKRRPHPRKAQ